MPLQLVCLCQSPSIHRRRTHTRPRKALSTPCIHAFVFPFPVSCSLASAILLPSCGSTHSIDDSTCSTTVPSALVSLSLHASDLHLLSESRTPDTCTGMASRPCACASAFLPRQLLLLLWLDNILSSLLSVNDFPQSAHVNGFSPRWLRSCRSNVACRANDLPHTEHLKFLSANQ